MGNVLIASGIGEPHIKTVDGLDYDFNGLGEYWMMKCQKEDSMLLLQARTRKHDNASATQFSAFAAQIKLEIDPMTDRVEFRYNESLKTICIILILILISQTFSFL